MNEIQVFDRARLRDDRSRHAAVLKDHDFLFQWSCDRLVERLKDIKREFSTALQIGARGNFKSPQVKNLAVMDISPKLLKNGVCADAEFFPFGRETLDLIISPLEFHAANDLPGALLQMKQALKPDGLFLAAMPGGDTLKELRESLLQAEIAVKGGVSPRVFPFADKRQMGALMQRAGFALPVVDSENLTVTYENMFGLLKDLRFMGESNVIRTRNKTYPGRELFPRAADHYAKHFSDPDGRIRATFEIIFLIGWSPHESQQKPLKPGSATMRLSDALGAVETATGEKAAP